MSSPLRDLNILMGHAESGEFYWKPLDPENPNSHVLIVGTTGAGKTQLLKTMAAEFVRLGVPVIVFDIHGEYEELVQDLGGRYIDFYGEVRINPLDPGGKKPKAVAYEIREILSNIFRGLGDIQKEKLYDAIIKSYEKRKIDPNKEPSRLVEPPDFNDLYTVIQEELRKNPKDTALRGLLARLRPLFEFNLFAAERGLNVSKLLESGITVIDLHTIPVASEELKAAVVVFTARKLWDHLYSLGSEKEPHLRVVLILDEAHRYVFEQSPVEYMLREGRKYGASVILASQLLRDFHQVAIGNTSLKIIFRVDDLTDQKKIVELFKIKRDLIPTETFKALVSWKEKVYHITTIPYYKYYKKYIHREIKKKSSYFTLKEAGKLESVSPSSISPMHSVSPLLDLLVKNLVEQRDIPLIDAFYQWSLNPTSASAGYGIKENYPFIQENLKIRYGADEADRAVRALKKYMKEILKKKDNIYELRDKIQKLLEETGGLKLLEQEALKRLRSLSPYEKLALYAAFEPLVIGSSRSYQEVQESLSAIGSQLNMSDVTKMAVRVNAVSKLLWITSSGSRIIDLKKPPFFKELYEELERSSLVTRMKEEFANAVKEAIDSWNIEVLQLLFHIISVRPCRFITSGVMGPERYVKIISRHISFREGYVKLLPRNLSDTLKEAFRFLMEHIIKVENLAGEYITYYTKHLAPYIERTTYSSECVNIRVAEPGTRAAVGFRVCVKPCLSKEDLIEPNTIYVAAVASPTLCIDRHHADQEIGIIIATPKGIISCNKGLHEKAKKFFNGLEEFIKANL